MPDPTRTPEIEDATTVLADMLTAEGYPTDVEQHLHSLVRALRDPETLVLQVHIGPDTADELRQFANTWEGQRLASVGQAPVHSDPDEEIEMVEADPSAAGFDRPEMGAPPPPAPGPAHIPEAGFGAPQPKVRQRPANDGLAEEDLVVEQPKQR